MNVGGDAACNPNSALTLSHLKQSYVKVKYGCGSEFVPCYYGCSSTMNNNSGEGV